MGDHEYRIWFSIDQKPAPNVRCGFSCDWPQGKLCPWESRCPASSPTPKPIAGAPPCLPGIPC